MADPAHGPGRAARGAAARGDRQGRHHHAVRPVQPWRSAECRDRIRWGWGRVAGHGRANDDLQHDDRVGCAGRLVPGRWDNPRLPSCPDVEARFNWWVRSLQRAGNRRLGGQSAGPGPGRALCGRIELDLGSVTPHVSGPDTVQTMHSVADLEARVHRVNKAYIVSCVNSRLEDLEAAAAVLAGRQRGGRRGVVRGRGERRDPAGGRSLGRLGNAARSGRSSAPRCMRPVHRTRDGPAGGGRSGDLGHESQFQGAHGIAGCEGVPGQSRGRRGIGGIRLHQGPDTTGRTDTRSIARSSRRRPRSRKRLSRSSTAFPSGCAAERCSCRRTTSIPTVSTGRTGRTRTG